MSNRTYMTGTRYYRKLYPNWKTGAGNQYDADSPSDRNDRSSVWNTFYRTILGQVRKDELTDKPAACIETMRNPHKSLVRNHARKLAILEVSFNILPPAVGGY